MARTVQNSFVSGILSPSLHARSDLKAYYSGLADAENFLVTKEGTLRKRRGLANASAADPSHRYFPYRFDRTGSGLLDVWREGSEVRARLIAKPLGQADAGSAAVVYAGAVSDAAFASLRSTQIGDTMFLTCKGVFFRKVTVTYASRSLTVEDWTQTERPPQPTSVRATPAGFDSSKKRTLTYGAFVVADGVQSKVKSVNASVDRDSWPAGAYVSVTVTYTYDTPAGGAQTGFDYLLLGKRTGGSYGEVSRWYPEDATLESDPQTGMTTATCTFRDENISAGDAIYEQTDTLGEGFTAPLAVDCFQQRLVFANASNSSGAYPMSLWFSQAGNLANFYANRPMSDDDAFSPTIAAKGPACIRWMRAYQESMILFTDSGLYAVGFSQNSGFSASTCRISKFSDIVPHPEIEPVSTAAGVIFVAADAKTVYSIAFDIQENALKPVNRSAFSAGLTESSPIVSLALQEYPDSVAWAVLADGTMLSLTFERDQEVYAWSRHRLPPGRAARGVCALGSVTDGDGAATSSDMAFLAETVDGGELSHAVWAAGHADMGSDIAAFALTLPLESQERPLAGFRRNVKDVTLVLNAEQAVQVAAADASGSAQTLSPTAGSAAVRRVAPRGHIDERGRLRIVSPAGACELMAVLADVEVPA